MSATARAAVPFAPLTESERAAVLNELALLLKSPHFRNSKRYTAVLEFVVRETLAGNADSLKERTLGVVVFKRAPDYDTSADPVVRVTAGEIRKRLAQFYQEEEHGSDLRIDLPLGSYVPEFKPAQTQRSFAVQTVPSTTPDAAPVPVEILTPAASISSQRKSRLKGSLWLLAASLLLIALAAGVLTAWNWNSPDDQLSQLWGPLLSAKTPVMILVGQPSVGPMDKSPADSIFYQQHSPTNEIFLPDGVALSHVSSVLGGHAYQVFGARQVAVSDVMKKPMILVGAFDNPWTVRLLKPLRFSLVSVEGGDSATEPRVLQIVDRKRQMGSPWVVDFHQPINKLTHDYAIIGRFQDDTTEGPVMVVAGIGSTGTQSAGEFVSSQAYMKQLAAWAPRHWSNKNMEAVIDTEIIDGQPAHPRVVAAEFW